MDRVLETVNFEAKFSSLPEFRPLVVAAVPSSPQAGPCGQVDTLETIWRPIGLRKYFPSISLPFFWGGGAWVSGLIRL
jgi:hypothetical protein